MSFRRVSSSSLIAFLAAAQLACGSGSNAPVDAGTDANTPADAAGFQLKILAINDFHGQLESPGSVPTSAGNVSAGGIAFLAAQFEAASLGDDSTIIVSAGDLIGGSPLISALFHDEPTIEAMNLAGLTINAVGNHEFDEDVDELMRMKNGGCHPVDGCYGGDGFAGANFAFLAANVVDSTSGTPIFPAYAVHTMNGVDVAFIGLTTKNTPATTTPVTGVEFLDEVSTINGYVTELQGMDVENIVVVVHEGGRTSAGSENTCIGLSGRIRDIVGALDPAVDLVISGHTHRAYNCVVNGIPVTSAGAQGVLFSDITLHIEQDTKAIASVTAVNRLVLHDVTPAPALVALVDTYKALSAPLENRVEGTITGNISKATSSAGESVLGNLVADAMLAATPGASVAFQQLGGLRADLTFAASAGETADGQVRYGELFAVQPFTNLVVTMTLSGQQIHDLLEEQWTVAFNPPLQVSSTMTYSWSPGSPPGDRVDPAAVFIEGTPLNLTAQYRITTNSLLSTGGSGHTVFEQGADVQTHAVDVEALADYVRANSPVAPPALGRITVAQ